MLELPGEATIECSRCNSTIFVSGADIYVGSVGSHERSMGTEEYYEGTTELVCPNCENEIQVTYEATEYPIGALNYSDVHADGAEIIKGVYPDFPKTFPDRMT